MLVLLLAAPGAEAATKPAGKPKLAISGQSGVVGPGKPVVVSGRITGKVKARRTQLKIVLQERTGSRWAVRKTVRPGSLTRFSVTWKAPAKTATKTLRVQLKKGKRALATSASWRLQVTQGAGSTQVITPAAVKAVTPGRLTLTGQVTVPKGQVLAGDVGPGSPAGFLVKVVSSKVQNGQTIVTTAPATLQEAIPEGRVKFSAPLTVPGRTGRRMQLRKRGECQGGGKFSVDGDTNFQTPRFESDFSWGFPKKITAELYITTGVSAFAEASITGAVDCKLQEIELANVKLATLRAQAGFIPIVLVVRYRALFNAQAKANGAIGSRVDASLTAKAGARYDDGTVSPIIELTPAFTFKPPTLEATANATATLSNKLEYLLYDLAGPTTSLDIGPELNADINATPAWTLDGVIDVNAKLEIPILDISTPPLSLFNKRVRIAQEKTTLDKVAPKYRGWVATEVSGTGPTEHVTSGWVADVSSTGFDAEGFGNSYQYSNSNDCQTNSEIEEVASGPFQMQARLEGGAEAVWRFSATPSGSGTSAWRGNCPQQVMPQPPIERSVFFGINGAMPLDPDSPPVTFSGSARVTPPPGVTWQQIVCMTRDSKDSDGDGLPDLVDLAPGTPGNPRELGIPGGPPRTVIPSKIPGVPNGARGLPTCPAS